MSPDRRQGRGAWAPAGIAAAILALGMGSALAEVEAGYDKGFFIKSEKFEAHFGARIQLQYASENRDTVMFDSLLGREIETKPLNELFVRRFKFNGAGHAFSPKVKWKFQLDVPVFQPGGSGTGNVRLEEAFFELTHRPWTQARIGQAKVPFGYEKMVSSGRLNLVDRSIVHAFFGIEQEPGLALFGESAEKKFRYVVSMTTGVSNNRGFDTLNDVSADGGSDFRYMGRVQWEPLAPYVFEQGAVSHTDKNQLTLQLGAMLNRHTVPLATDLFLPSGAILPFGADVLGADSVTFPPATETLLASWSGVSSSRKPYDRKEVELVAGWRYGRFALEGQAIAGIVDPDLRYLQAQDPNLTDLDFDNTGMRVQGGVFIVPSKLEIAARWALVEREAEASFLAGPPVEEEIETTEWRAGVNWYFAKHDWKWQTDVGRVDNEWRLNDERLEVPDAALNPNVVIQNNPREDFIIRTQFQLNF